MASHLFPKTNADIYLGILPFYHIYGEIDSISHYTCLSDPGTGAVNLLHYPFRNGASVAIMKRFDPVQFCANIERYKINRALVVPPVLVVLARHPGTWSMLDSQFIVFTTTIAVDQYDLSSLQTLMSGAAPLSASLTQQVGFMPFQFSICRFKEDVRCWSGLRVGARVMNVYLSFKVTLF